MVQLLDSAMERSSVAREEFGSWRRNRQFETRLLKQEFLALFRGLLCNMSRTCEAIGISRHQLYVWLEKDQAFATEVWESQESMIDFTESKLYGRINADDTTAMIFTLKCKGKHRGWVERTEITGADGAPIQIDYQPVAPQDYAPAPTPPQASPDAGNGESAPDGPGDAGIPEPGVQQ